MNDDLDAAIDLCRRGDYACGAGELASLADVARELAALMAEPLHCALIALADRCRAAPARALADWRVLREQVAEAMSAS